MRRLSAALLVAALLGLGALGCGGTQGTLTINLVVPAGDDPFADAAEVHVQVGEPAVADKVVPVTGGHFDLSLQFSPAANLAGDVVVEALASDGSVIARGRSPVVALSPQAFSNGSTATESVTVWVGRLGRVGLHPMSFAHPRAQPAIAAVPRLGVVIAGGSEAGAPVADTELYFTYEQSVVQGQATLPMARSGAIAVGYDRPDQTFGGALLAGGSPAAAASELDAYDPQPSSADRWVAVTTDASLARSGATPVELASGGWLLSGGTATDGTPLATATLVTGGAAPTVKATSAMQAARVGHTATVGIWGQADGALLFGGVTGNAPIAELYDDATATFSPAQLPADVGTRTGHTATTLGDGRVVIAGGTDASGAALAALLVITPSSLAVDETHALPKPRTGHVAFLTGGELVLCGGAAGDGTLLGDCDVLDGTTLAPLRTIKLGAPRVGASAFPLDSGETIIVGGTAAGAQPSTAVELYTPLK